MQVERTADSDTVSSYQVSDIKFSNWKLTPKYFNDRFHKLRIFVRTGSCK